MLSIDLSITDYVGIVFSDYHEQLKLQRNASMVVLRSLGYGKKSVENKIIEEAECLSRAFNVSHRKVPFSQCILSVNM